MLLGLGAALSWFGRSDLLSDAVSHQVGPAVRTLIGMDAVLGRFEVRPLRGEVRIEGLALTHYAPNDSSLHGAPVLLVDAAEVALGWRGYKPTLGRLEIWKPTIHLRVGPDGLRELHGIELPTDAGLERMPWNELWVHGARIQVENPKWTVQVAGLDISPAPDDRNDLAIDTITFQMRDFKQTVANLRIPDVFFAPGNLEVPELDLHAPALDLSGSVFLKKGEVDGSVDLAVRLPELEALTQPNARLDGTVRLTADVHGLTSNPDVRGHLEVTDLSRTASASRTGSATSTQISTSPTACSPRARFRPAGPAASSPFMQTLTWPTKA